LGAGGTARKLEKKSVRSGEVVPEDITAVFEALADWGNGKKMLEPCAIFNSETSGRIRETFLQVFSQTRQGD
jgi:hypothetical protein